jgi:glycerate-2-kinase
MDRSFPLLREAFRKGVEGASPHSAVSAFLKKEAGRLLVKGEDSWRNISPGSEGKIFLISTGKAASGMYRAAVLITGEPDTGIVASGDISASCQGATCFRAGHPFPNEGSVTAARAILSAIASAGEEDTLLYLLSGGSSAMVALPEEGISLEDKIKTIQTVMTAGASIGQLNCVRKVISQVKGGKLARGLRTHRACVLVISDVPGNELSVIGSGPLYSQTTTPDPLGVIEALSVAGSVPPSVMRFLREKGEREIEAPSRRDIDHVIIADNNSALRTAGTFLQSHGYRVVISEDQYEGEALAAGISLGRRVLEISEKSPHGNTAFLSGGETVVKVRGRGTGGRNQELAIGAAMFLKGTEGVVGLAAATDGIDGNSKAAGAFFDGRLLDRARRRGMDHEQYIKESDSFTFLNGTGYSFITGQTGTNVIDLFICLIHR